MEENLKVQIKELLERRERLGKELKIYNSEESREPIQYNIDKITWELEELIEPIKKDIEEREINSQKSIDKLRRESNEAIENLKKEANEPIARLKRELEVYESSEAREPIQYNIDKITWKLEDDIKEITSKLQDNILAIENEFKNYKGNTLDDLEQLGIDFKEFNLDKIKNKDKEVEVTENDEKENSEDVLNEEESVENKEIPKDADKPEKIEIPDFLKNTKTDESFENIMNVVRKMPRNQKEKEVVSNTSSVEENKTGNVISANKVSVNSEKKENVKIVIGREAKIIIGKEVFKVDAKYVKEGINLNFEQLKDYIFEQNGIEITDIKETQLKEAFEKGLLDPTVLNIIDRANLTLHERKTLLNDQINKVRAAIKNEEYYDKSEVKYDMTDLSKTSLIKRLLRKEINTDEKNALINNARVTNQNGISTIDGEYKPDWKSKFLAKIMRKDILMLPSKVENISTEKSLRDRIAVDNSKNQIEENVKKIVEETEHSIAYDVKNMVNTSENEK